MQDNFSLLKLWWPDYNYNYNYNYNYIETFEYKMMGDSIRNSYTHNCIITIYVFQSIITIYLRILIKWKWSWSHGTLHRGGWALLKIKGTFKVVKWKSICKTNKGSTPNLQPSVPLFPVIPTSSMNLIFAHICSYLLRTSYLSLRILFQNSSPIFTLRLCVIKRHISIYACIYTNFKHLLCIYHVMTRPDQNWTFLTVSHLIVDHLIS